VAIGPVRGFCFDVVMFMKFLKELPTFLGTTSFTS
jgi:hypothetical protein